MRWFPAERAWIAEKLAFVLNNCSKALATDRAVRMAGIFSAHDQWFDAQFDEAEAALLDRQISDLVE